VSDTVFQTFIPDSEVSKDGAGSVNRTLEAKLLNPLARYLLAHPKEKEIRVDVKDGSLVIEPVTGRTAGRTTRAESHSKLPTA
jgi:ATP-dependent Clp protease ATP-binding subunit ClpA